MPKVYKKTGARAGESFFLRKKAVILGRAMQCDFLFNDAGISRQHAQIEQTPQGYIIRDMNSGNGTYVRGEKITGYAPLKDRDEFALGSVLFTFFLNDNAVPEDINGANPASLTPMYRDETVMASGTAGDEVQVASSAFPIPQNNNSNEPSSSQLVTQKTQTKPLKGVGKAYYAQDDLMFASLVNMDMKGMLGDQVRKQNRNITEKYAIMFKISQVIAESTDLDSLVSNTLKLVMEIFPAKRAYLFMKDEISGDLDPYQTYPPELLRKQPAQYSKTILREIIEKKVAIMTQDAEHDDQFASNQSIVMAKICSAMVVPLLVQGSLLGAFQLDSSVNAAFDGEDMDLFVAICNQVAVGINSKILTQALTKEISHRKKVSRFHSPAVLQALMEASDEQGLEPQKKFCTIFFSDIKGFTAMSERLKDKPEKLAKLLNEYFALMYHILLKHNGTLDKFIGDAIMAIFGAPYTREDDAERALLAAHEMLRELEKFNDKRPEELQIHIRIGINSGHCIAGPIGSPKRLEYTVLGDTVNVASRIESNGFPDQIIVGESTYEIVKDKFPFKALDPIRVKNKTHPLKIYQFLLNEFKPEPSA